MDIPHENSAKHYDFVFERRFGAMYNVLTQNNLSKIRALTPKGKILDFGAGTGRISIPLAMVGFEVTAIDCSSQMLEELRRKSQAHNVNIVTHITLSNAISNDFDIAIAIFTVLAYIKTQSELEDVFQNIYNSLRPGGLFMFDLEKRDGYDRICRFNNGIVIGNPDDLVKVRFQDNDFNLCDYYERVKGTLPNGENFEYVENFVIKFWTINEVRSIYSKIGFNEIDRFSFANADYFILERKSE